MSLNPAYWSFTSGRAIRYLGGAQAVAAGETVTVDLDQTATVGVFKIT